MKTVQDLKQRADLMSNRISALESAHLQAMLEHDRVWYSSHTRAREENEVLITECERALEATWAALEAQRAADLSELQASVIY